MAYQDPSSRVSWVEFEASAKNTISSAQAVIQQLTGLLETGKHVDGYQDDYFNETVANLKSDPNWKNRAGSDTWRANNAGVYDGSKNQEDNEEYYAKYFKTNKDRVNELYTSKHRMLTNNLKQEHCLDSNQDECVDTLNNGGRVPMDNTSLNEGVDN